MRLAKKIALITGAGAGIGRATALAFAKEGARVVLMGRTLAPLEALAAEIGPAALPLAGDVSRAADVERVVARTIEHFGGLDVVVNNAGVLIVGTAESHREEDFDLTMDVNIKGVWLVSKAAIPHLRRAGGGSIVNLSSVAGLMGIANRVAYGASKGAVTIMTKCMAADLARDNIRVNCICPAVVETELVADIIRKAADPEAVRKERLALHPLGRFGQPEDIAACAIYLGSDESRWVTGAAFPIDGGYTATKT